MINIKAIFSKRAFSTGYYIGIYTPFLYCAALAWIILDAKQKAGAQVVGDIPFYWSLPMVFFFVAMPIYTLSKEVSRLKNRIKQLEDSQKR